ncbi:MAG TPA: hypothetical protein VMU54_14945 [Planctomycetota bacterium]|nr:hypothetical protein [Planctomycetota bacterium]
MDALEAELQELKKHPPSQDKEKPAPGQAEAPKPAGQQEEDEKRKKLEEEFRKALGPPENKPAPPQNAPFTPSAPPSGSAFKLIDLAFDILAVGGTSSASEAEMRDLEAGGHDPKNRGFTMQNVELTFAGVVDPYLRGDANIVLQIDQNGDTTIELEEAYLTTLEFPYNLQLKAGQYFSQFGRLNATHPHTWDFVDQPVINSRLLGEDGFRGPGGQLSWLTPLPFFAELTGSVQNAQGGTAKSFRDVPGDVIDGRTIVGRPVRSLGDIAYVIRLKTSFDPTDELTIVPGVSALFGPNASALDTRTGIYGMDFYAKWKPLANDQGWPFVAWQTETMRRTYQAGAVFDTTGVLLAGRKTLEDWGAYSQVVWGFARPWTMGLRFDYANGQRDSYAAGVGVPAYDSVDDPFRDRRERGTIDLTYYPSEFSKVRIQYNYDHSPFLSNVSGDAHSVYVQFEILFGAHGAHKF